MSVVVAAGLAFFSAFAAGADPAPNIAGETIEQAAARTGYTAEEVRKYFPPIQEWDKFAVELSPGKMADSFARDRFKAPPAPGIHPRVYFNADDVPAIRRRFKDNHVGRAMMGGIRGMLLQIAPTPEPWENLGGPKWAEFIQTLKAKGILALRRQGYHGPWVGGWINTLAEGNMPEDLERTWNDTPAQNNRRYLMHLLPFEAFRCLIDDDEKGGKRIAAALTTLAGRYAKDMDKWSGTDNWQSIYWFVNSDSIGLTYDWAYKWMTDAQRAAVRKTIAGMTRGKTFLGLDQLPAVPGNTSNWIIIHANLLPMVLSIEGEEGYDPSVYARLVEGLRKWVYVAAACDGAPFEGLVKSTYAPQWLIPLAKRGEAFIGSEWALNHVRKYHLNVMLPWGGEYMFETGIASPRDIAPWKYAYPTDPVVDMVYGAQVRQMFAEDLPAQWVNHRTTYAPWWPLLIFVDDPLGSDGAAYDYDKAFDQVMASLAKTEPLTYFSDFYGCMAARSAWDRQAHFLYFEPRNMPGGHSRDARNEFVYAALGRVWATRTTAVEDGSERHSVVLIDGKGQGHQCPPGRTAAFVDTPVAAFAAGDAAWAYSHALAEATNKKATPITISPNDSRLRPSGLPWMNQPWSFMPSWNKGEKGGGRHGNWIDFNPVKYAFRTAGLVRGRHPYVIITDEIRKDDAEHLYEWLMQVPDDLDLAAKPAGGGDAGAAFDLVLSEKGGDRRLLVRVLQSGASTAEQVACMNGTRLETYKSMEGKTEVTAKRLVLPLKAAAGTYKILLFAHRQGEAFPVTTWDAGRTKLTVQWPDLKDEYTFTPNPDGRTRVAMSRDGHAVVEVK